MLWRRKVGGQAYQRLVIEIEMRRQDHLLDLGPQSNPGAEVIEGATDREGRRREDRRAPLRVNPFSQQQADVDRRGAQEQVLGARDLAEPVDAIRVGPEQSLFDQPGRGLEASANHLQLTNALVWLISAEPLADAAHRLP